MGGNQSQYVAEDKDNGRPNGKKTYNSGAGATAIKTDAQTTTTTTSASAPTSNPSKGMPCFCLDGLAQTLRLQRRVDRDPIGTPLPETPIFQRKRRQQVQEVLRQQEKNDPLVPFDDRREEGIVTATLSRVVEEDELAQQQQQQKQQTDGSNGGLLEGDMLNVGTYEGPECETLLNEKYELLEAIGVGSTSTVHRCVLKASGMEYACKVIDVMLIEERFQGMMAQFQTEIAALRQLHHPNIIKLYDVYLTGDKIYIIMELMEGGEIFDYVVQKGTLTEDEASRIVRKVTSALVYMHENNICHRDLKPENLLLKKRPEGPDDDINVKIIDFGLSKAMEEPVARTFLGTRGYLAPEMLQRRDYTKAVDMWALGVIVFVLVCGCLPFDDDSATVPSDDLVRTKFVLRFPRWAKNLSDSAKDLLAHLLDVNPRLRYTAEQALNHPWVQGRTAPIGNLLASPGKIKTSPAFANGTYKTSVRKKHSPAADQVSPPPVRPKRKTSI